MYVKSTAVALMVAVNSASAGVMYKESVMKQDPDFGLCLPTMKFEGGLGGRTAMDFTFLPTDPLCARGQQEASNPSTSTLAMAPHHYTNSTQTSLATASATSCQLFAEPTPPPSIYAANHQRRSES